MRKGYRPMKVPLVELKLSKYSVPVVEEFKLADGPSRTCFSR